MKTGRTLASFGTLALLAPWSLTAQTFPSDDPVLRSIWTEGTERSQVATLSQVLLDSLGPRLTGSPESKAASDWVVATYAAWGIEARQERYGTWRGWRRGPTHVDLLEPRVRTLDATMRAWSPGTAGPVSGPVVALPAASDPAELDALIAGLRGKFVLVSFPQPTCRPDDNWEEWGRESTIERLRSAREEARAAWGRRQAAAGENALDMIARLEAAGVAGILTSTWSEGWGVQKVFDAYTERVPMLEVGCEDYGLLFRLADRAQGPVISVDARAEALGEIPVWNTIGVIPGAERPDEYVLLSAHFDSWDGASGATDNGTGTVTMMEALRILKATYPNPRRTIMVGHWNGEEQGLNGSRAFVTDHPEVVEGLQALFNQDNGTGRVTTISMQGLTGVAPFFAAWFAKMPSELISEIDLVIPGSPGGGGTDNASFVCAGAPAFGLSSLSWDYNTYTWHTDRDTFDKVVMDDVRDNAILTAMLAYLASEEPEMLPRERRVLASNPRTGQPGQWPMCRDGARVTN